MANCDASVTIQGAVEVSLETTAHQKTIGFINIKIPDEERFVRIKIFGQDANKASEFYTAHNNSNIIILGQIETRTRANPTGKIAFTTGIKVNHMCLCNNDGSEFSIMENTFFVAFG